MATHQAHPDLIPWKPTSTVLPEEWIALCTTLTTTTTNPKRIYIVEARYDAQSVALLLQSWGLSWQIITAALLWEYKEHLSHVTLHGTTQVLSHITEVEHIVQYIEDDNLPPLLNPPYKDLGALLITVASYYHALKTLQKQSGGHPYVGAMQANIERIGQTLLNIAKRLGIWHFKRQIEDLVEQLCYPDRFAEASKEHARILARDAHLLTETVSLLKEIYQRETQQRIVIQATPCGIVGMERRKQDAHTTVTSQKAELTGFDLVTFDVIVPTVRECYEAFGVFSQIGLIQDRVTDQIATPKPNGYSHIAFGLVLKPSTPYTTPTQALLVCQLQIATQLMQSIMVYGCLHPKYYPLYQIAEREDTNYSPSNAPLWNSEEGQVFSTIKEDLAHIPNNTKNPIVVYNKHRTPVALPKGATALDLAFYLDKDTGTIGLHAVEAFINNRKAPLNRKLDACDVVEIITSKEIQVKEHWRKDAITPLAQNYISGWLNQHSLELKGYYLLRQVLERANYMAPIEALNTELDLLVKQYDLGTRQEYLRRLDDSENSPYTPDWAAQKIMQQIRERNEPKPESNSNWVPVLDMQRIARQVSIKHQRVCSFCHPTYPDDDEQIMGYIRKRTRELIVHRTSCPRLIDHNADQQSQLLPMIWQLQPPAFKVSFFLKVQDREGLVLDITKLLYQRGCNLLAVNAEVIQYVEAHIRFTIEAKTDEEVLEYWKGFFKIENITSVELDKSLTPITTYERLQKLREQNTLIPKRTEVEIDWEEVVNMLPARSPLLKSNFDISRPAHATMFFGRSAETNTLYRVLCEGDSGKALVLYGPRRSGKSSICKNFIERRKHPPFWSVYCTLQSAADQNEEMIFMRLAEEIGDEFDEQLHIQPPVWQCMTDHDPQIRFRKFLQECIAKAGGRHLILALDEFGGALDSYNQHTLEYRFFLYWKELISAIPELSLIIALPTNAHNTLTSKSFSYAFNFAEPLSITYLDHHSAERLLADPLKEQHIAIHPHTVAYTAKLTGGNPYYMTMIGDRLITQLNREPLKQWVGDEDLRFIIRQIVERESTHNFSYLKAELQNEYELRILEVLVELTSRTSHLMVQLHKIANACKLSPSETRKHLERMRSGLLLEETIPYEKGRFSANPYYSFKIELVRQWLIHNHWFFL